MAPLLQFDCLPASQPTQVMDQMLQAKLAGVVLETLVDQSRQADAHVAPAGEFPRRVVKGIWLACGIKQARKGNLEMLGQISRGRAVFVRGKLRHARNMAASSHFRAK